MAFVSVYLGLGSNQGNRLQNLMQALDLLDKGLGCRYTALSRIIETKAWGFKGDKFLNACVLYRIFRKGTPEEQGLAILDLCKEIERTLGREDNPEFDETGRRVYHNRTIDIDILFYGTETIDTERLTVPHPLIAERDFVKIPLAEIAKPSLRAAFPDLFS
jgi:2-amino-4-hydroxy-6-hydroxymethyldihydropteridine diphosphokinase